MRLKSRPERRHQWRFRAAPRRADKLTDDIIAGLKSVYDPEIPADIYEIGLIYKIDIGDDRAVKIDMSLTSPNCPSAQELPIMVENAVSSVPGVKETKVPWCGTRLGTPAGCRTRPNSCSICGDYKFWEESTISIRFE